MSRIARVVAKGFPHHVIQRGNNREKVFFTHEDRERYLSLLRTYSEKWNSPILAYCLMTNHVHLLTKPKSEESLSKMMQGLTLCYTQYCNRAHKRTGRLWESRYHSCVVERDTYLWVVARYIEQIPVRAKVVKKPEDFRYSSARAHILGVKDETLTEPLFNEETRADYKKFVKGVIPEKEKDAIRTTARTGRPLGSDRFLARLQRKLKRNLAVKARGRPRKAGIERK